MKKILNKKLLGYVALALACVMIGTVLTDTTQAEKTVVTSPFTEAIAQVRGSVVGVNNYQMVSTNYGNGYDNYGGSMFPWSDFFGFGFGFGDGYGNGYGNGRGNGQSTPKEEILYATGSGVVVADKYVLTNYHVAEDATSLKISLPGGGSEEEELLAAALVASDKDLDVAVLYVPDLEIAPVTLGDSDTLQVGDWAICIGNPIGFTGTATAGIISGLDREIANGTSTDKYGRTSEVTNSMIQTDAPINNGNSGGGMFSVTGELMGIPTLKYSGTRSNGATVESIGMCIPINAAKPVIEEALKANTDGLAIAKTDANSASSGNDLYGKPRLGVTVSTVTANAGSNLPNGACVNSVDEGSPAEKAGLKEGDVIVEVDGTVIASTSEMMEIVGAKKEGDTVSVKAFRANEAGTDGEYMDFTVVLAILDGVAQ